MCFERLLQAFARWQPGILFDTAAQPILEYRWIDSYSQPSLRTQFKVATVYSIHNPVAVLMFDRTGTQCTTLEWHPRFLYRRRRTRSIMRSKTRFSWRPVFVSSHRLGGVDAIRKTWLFHAEHINYLGVIYTRQSISKSTNTDEAVADPSYCLPLWSSLCCTQFVPTDAKLFVLLQQLIRMQYAFTANEVTYQFAVVA